MISPLFHLVLADTPEFFLAPFDQLAEARRRSAQLGGHGFRCADRVGAAIIEMDRDIDLALIGRR